MSAVRIGTSAWSCAHWENRIGDWRRLGHDVYVSFNNDDGGHAVRNAWTLRDLSAPEEHRGARSEPCAPRSPTTWL